MNCIKILFLFWLVIFSSCLGRREISFNEEIYVSNIEDEFITTYVDSIDRINSTDELPAFLLNPYFDYDCHARWISMQHRLSYRALIINSVTKKDGLEYIINSEEKKLDVLPLPDTTQTAKGSIYNFTIPFYNFSYRSLAKYRLEELKNDIKKE